MQRTVNSTPKITVTLVKNEKQNTFIIILEYAVYFVGWSNFDGILKSRNVHVLYKKSSINILFIKQDTFRDNNNNNNNNNYNNNNKTTPNSSAEYRSFARKREHTIDDIL